MIYNISARLNNEHAEELLRRMEDGSICAQGPDGGEIVDALNAAAISANGRVNWNMGCFCNPPLAHERITVFDHHFEDLQINPIGKRQTHEGASFMEHLRRTAANQT